MPIDRRALLLGAAGAAGGLAVDAALRRAPSLRRGVARAAPPPPRASCAGRSWAGTAAPERPPLHPGALARFVDPLPIPPVLAPDGLRADPRDPSREIPYYRVPMREAEIRAHRDLPPTRVWGHGGCVPGPTIEARSGDGVLVEWANELPRRHFLPIDPTLHGVHEGLPEARTVTHVHGAKAPPESDGYPDDWYAPGRSALSHYPTRQDAAMLWYHDHAMGVERLNVYAGLMGVFFVRDAVEDALGLPAGRHEVPLVLCDRLFDDAGQLRYPVSGMPEAPWVESVFGDVFLVNGKIFPYLEVEPRAYRLRILNASNSRFAYLSLSGRPFFQIGTDQGLLPAPVELRALTLAPGERADVIADFGAAAGTEVVLRSQAFALAQLRVRPGRGGPAFAPPRRLRPIESVASLSPVTTRRLTLDGYEDPATRRPIMLLDGKYWAQPVTERPVLGTAEVWELVNLTEDTHPIHLHLVRFRILDRQPFDADEYAVSRRTVALGAPRPPGPDESGWKDTVRAEPGTITRIVARFEGYAGRYVWHCHVLEHAANEMMRPFEVVTG